MSRILDQGRWVESKINFKMAAKGSIDDPFSLSLTGSQVSVGSARRPASAKSTRRQNSSPGPRAKPGGSRTPTQPRKDLPRSSSRNGGTPLASQRSSVSDVPGSVDKLPAQNEFLALFESTTQPKILKPKQQAQRESVIKKPHEAWATPIGSAMNSARSGAAGDTEGIESRVSSNNRFTHSVFQPVSARSSSTVDDEDIRDHHTLHQHKTATRDELNRSRTSLHGENMFDGSQSRESEKAHKLNSIANNMTSQARSPSTKTSLLGMENSYQNIKHKTPVNQVRQTPHLTLPVSSARSQNQDDFLSPRLHSASVDLQKHQQAAATRIQRWYRRHLGRKKSDVTAVKRLLEAKREKLGASMDYSLEAQQRTDNQRKKTREEKARQARQQAIDELHKKREAKKKKVPTATLR